MNALIESIYETKLVENAEGELKSFSSGIPYHTGVFLNQIIKNENLNRTLEIGMACGLSTLFICQAHKDKGKGVHTAIDPYQTRSWKSTGLLNVKRAKLDHILRFLETPSHEGLPQLLTAKEKFDFIFVDGSHAFNYAFVDYFYTNMILANGGYLVFDDLYLPSVRKVVSFALSSKDYQLVKTSTTKHLPLLSRVAKIGRRILQNPLEIDTTGFKFSSENICVLRKLAAR